MPVVLTLRGEARAMAGGGGGGQPLRENEDEQKKERRGQKVKSAKREIWRVEITSSSSGDRKLPHLLIFTFFFFTEASACSADRALRRVGCPATETHSSRKYRPRRLRKKTHTHISEH